MFNKNIKELIHLEGNAKNYPFEEDILFYPVQEVEINNKNLLYFQVYDGNSKSVNVPGFKASKKYITRRGYSAVKVRIVPEKKKKEISDIIEKHTEGPINFW